MRFLPMLMAVAVLSCSPDAGKTERTANIPPRQTIETLVGQAASFQEQKQADSALAYARRADSLAADSPGDTPARLQADIFYLLGRNHYEQKSYDSAGVHLEKALAIAEENRADTLISDILLYLGRACFRQRAYDRAAELFRRAVVLREAIYGRDHAAVMEPLSALLRVLYDQLHYMEVEPLGRRLEALALKVEGPDSPAVGRANFYLAWVADNQQQYGLAHTHYRKAIAIMERQSPVNYELLAAVYGVFSLSYFHGGDLIAAEKTALRALAIAEEHLGRNHPVAAQIMMRLLTIYSQVGRFELAEAYARRALAIRQAQEPIDKEDVIESLYALGYVYREERKLTEAAAYVSLACDMTLDTFGPQDPKLMYYRTMLAQLYESLGRLPEAERLYVSFLLEVEKVLGLAHRSTLWAITGLAGIWTQQGRFAEAESLLVGKLDALERECGPRYCYIGILLQELLDMYWAAGKYDEAFACGEKLLTLRRELAEKVCALFSGWIMQNPVGVPDMTTLALASPGRYKDSVAFDMILYGKAIVCDAVMKENAAAYCSADAAVGEKIKHRAELCTAIANLAANEDAAGADLRRRLSDLYDSLEIVEAYLTRQCSDFGAALAERRSACTLIADDLPSGGVLLEYVYSPVDTMIRIGGEYPDSLPSHYLVFALAKDREMGMIDLGDASEIDSLVAEARRLIYDAEERVYSPAAPYLEERLQEVTGELHRRLIVPVDSFLAGVSTLLIAPDGMLNLLPFEILATANETYLIEQYLISYVSSGRDIRGFDSRSVADGEALIVGDPDYNHSRTASPSPDQDNPSLFASADVAAEEREAASRTRGGRDRFTPLQYSREESQAIASSLRQTNRLTVREWYGADAGEGNLKGMTDPPYILHLSTHGYFTAADLMAGLSGAYNPLLRSGLGLAGANSPPPPARDSRASDDGLLTALEVSGLNLQGTALVTLSACESGVGAPSAGEGVFGLQRAFLHAGAQSLVMSLWRVPDRETAELMKRFYELWLGGMSRAEALRASALEILRKSRQEKTHGHPLFWGGFVLIGNPH